MAGNMIWNFNTELPVLFGKKYLKQAKITTAAFFPPCTFTHKVHFRKFWILQ